MARVYNGIDLEIYEYDYKRMVAYAQANPQNNSFIYHRANGSMTVPPGVSTQYDIWSVSAGQLVIPASATVISMSSSSALDTAAGTGARTVFVSGLDSNYDLQSEIVSLLGVTTVTTLGTYRRLNSAIVASGGALLNNQGDITLSISGQTQGRISATQSRMRNTHYTVPSGYTGFVISYDASASKDTSFVGISGLLSGFVSSGGGVTQIDTYIVNESGARFAQDGISLSADSSGFHKEFPVPTRLSERQMIKLSGASSSIGTPNAEGPRVNGNFEIIVVKNEFLESI